MATSCEDEDLALALALQNELPSSCSVGNTNNTRKRNRSTSVVDECWETIDPTPDIRQLFMEFNDTYFEGKLAGCEVKWSPRMTLCAGLCCYEGRGGLCSIKLSLPLLKLRPRRDLVQTLLHEMIHALLFVTHNNKDHDAHGPEFHKHMYRINKQSGANITVYHNFHDEVDLYRQHWWQCNGPCQKRPPYYGFVKRAMNRAPSPRDPWWSDHQQNCGGTYTKVKEPEDYQKKKRKMKDESNDVSGKNVSSDSGMPKIYDLWKKEGSSGVLSTSDKENSLQKSNIESVSSVTPFSGKGYVLGSLKKGNPTDTGSYLGSSLKNNRIFLFTPYENRDKKVVEVKDDSPIQSNRSGEMILRTDEGNLALRKDIDQSICGQKTDTAGKIKNKRRPGNHSELTIIDAFKRVEKVDRKTPVVIVDDSPGKHLHSPINLNLVPCPVCLINVQENLINSHLDSCLL